MGTATKTPVKTWGFYLDGKWLTEGERFEVFAPYDRAVVGASYRATAAHAEAAVRAAQRAFQITRKMPGYERQAILRAISEGISKRREEFARLIALEAGKPIRTARAEVDRAIFTFAVAAEEATRIGGEWLPLDWQASTAGRAGIVRRFALGPILAITPFNFPLNLVAHKVAPAIAAGCTTVLKPAPQTPLTSLLLAEVIEQAGLPAGRFERAAARESRSRKIGRRRSPENAHLHRQRAGGLGAEREVREEKSDVGTGRQCRSDRSLRCGCGRRRGSLRSGRLFVCRPELHFRAADLRAAQRRAAISRALLAGVRNYTWAIRSMKPPTSVR